MSSKSNDNGRALEFCFVDHFIQNYPQASLLKNTPYFQKRDQIKFKSLPEELRDRFIKASMAYLCPEEIEDTIIEIERLADGDGKQGDVTDIRIKLKNQKIINISLKNNHFALKHQRPGALFSQLKVNDPEQEKIYYSKLGEIEHNFYQQAKPYSSSIFNEVKKQNYEVIDNLYSSVNELVCYYLNRYSSHANNYFQFLIGNKDFIKIIVTKNNLIISDYKKIPLPLSMTAEVYNKNHIRVIFDNEYIISMRLHTASSRFFVGKKLSLKFDTLLENKNILPIRIINF